MPRLVAERHIISGPAERHRSITHPALIPRFIERASTAPPRNNAAVESEAPARKLSEERPSDASADRQASCGSDVEGLQIGGERSVGPCLAVSSDDGEVRTAIRYPSLKAIPHGCSARLCNTRAEIRGAFVDLVKDRIQSPKRSRISKSITRLRVEANVPSR